MPGRHERNADAIDRAPLAIADAVERSGARFAIPHLHDGDCLWRSEHSAVARAGMIGMAVRDHGLVDAA